MWLSIAGSLTAAIAVAIAVRAVRDRRALAADVRTLRAELRQLARAVHAQRGRPAADEGTAAWHRDVDTTPPADADVAQPRGSRTLH